VDVRKKITFSMASVSMSGVCLVIAIIEDQDHFYSVVCLKLSVQIIEGVSQVRWCFC
jgi:hypothetical protein